MSQTHAIWVFGNRDSELDDSPFAHLARLRSDFPHVEFTIVPPNADLPLPDDGSLIVLDTVQGISQPTVLTHTDLDRISLSPRTSVHDFDLGLQIKLALKLGKIHTVAIIGLPQGIPSDYDSIQEIVRKLVAQDIQGS